MVVVGVVSSTITGLLNWNWLVVVEVGVVCEYDFVVNIVGDLNEYISDWEVERGVATIGDMVDTYREIKSQMKSK